MFVIHGDSSLNIRSSREISSPFASVFFSPRNHSTIDLVSPEILHVHRQMNVIDDPCDHIVGAPVVNCEGEKNKMILVSTWRNAPPTGAVFPLIPKIVERNLQISILKAMMPNDVGFRLEFFLDKLKARRSFDHRNVFSAYVARFRRFDHSIFIVVHLLVNRSNGQTAEPLLIEIST